MIILKVDEAASTNFFFIIYNSYHIANQLHQHSYISRTIASSQHHPRETRPLLSQPNLYKIFYIGMSYDEIVSYITRNESIHLLICYIVFIYFFFFPSSHILYEVESIYLLILFLIFIYFFFLRLFSYLI